MNESQLIYPWLVESWKKVQSQINQNRLPHAFLFVGAEGLGKRTFADFLAQSLLCFDRTKEGFACSQCRSCQLIKAGTHPDCRLIAPEEKGKAIKIDQIRELIVATNQTAQLGAYKTIIIDPAQAMNLSAANALLKTLEEPFERTLFVLITPYLSSVAATIRSRCQIVYFSIPSQSMALDWLKQNTEGVSESQLILLLALAQGAPLKVIDLIAQEELKFREALFSSWQQFAQGQLSVVDLAEGWKAFDLERLLNHWMSWTADMIRIKTVDSVNVVNEDFSTYLHLLSQCIGTESLYYFYDALLQARQSLFSTVNLNQQLLIERLLLTWTH